MSEAHEKTRIRQLEDAAAHWEHKYANARQYNRNLEERNQKLEAALRKYGIHTLACASLHSERCDCGWTEALCSNFAPETNAASKEPRVQSRDYQHVEVRARSYPAEMPVVKLRIECPCGFPLDAHVLEQHEPNFIRLKCPQAETPEKSLLQRAKDEGFIRETPVVKCTGCAAGFNAAVEHCPYCGELNSQWKAETPSKSDGWTCKSCGTHHAIGTLSCLNRKCRSYEPKTSMETGTEPARGIGQQCHLCHNVHDLLSACPPVVLDAPNSEWHFVEGRECGACGQWIPEGGSSSCSLDHAVPETAVKPLTDDPDDCPNCGSIHGTHRNDCPRK
jgi:hypothetical protein